MINMMNLCSGRAFCFSFHSLSCYHHFNAHTRKVRSVNVDEECDSNSRTYFAPKHAHTFLLHTFTQILNSSQLNEAHNSFEYLSVTINTREGFQFSSIFVVVVVFISFDLCVFVCVYFLLLLLLLIECFVHVTGFGWYTALGIWKSSDINKVF